MRELGLSGRVTTLTMNELCFSPTVLRVAPGSEVTIVNRDSFEHPLARPGGEWSWNGAPGDRTTVRLGRAGIYPFFCYVHPSMVGVVVVGDGGGTAGSVIGVDGAAPAAAGQSATAAAAPAADRTGPLPVAWLLLVALAALVGAAAGTHLRSRGPA